jgi:hypothetical protein
MWNYNFSFQENVRSLHRDKATTYTFKRVRMAKFISFSGHDYSPLGGLQHVGDRLTNADLFVVTKWSFRWKLNSVQRLSTARPTTSAEKFRIGATTLNQVRVIVDIEWQEALNSPGGNICGRYSNPLTCKYETFDICLSWHRTKH